MFNQTPQNTILDAVDLHPGLPGRHAVGCLGRMDSVPRLRMAHVRLMLPLRQLRPPQKRVDEQQRAVRRPFRVAGSGRRCLKPDARSAADIPTPQSADGGATLGETIVTG